MAKLKQPVVMKRVLFPCGVLAILLVLTILFVVTCEEDNNTRVEILDAEIGSEDTASQAAPPPDIETVEFGKPVSFSCNDGAKFLLAFAKDKTYAQFMSQNLGVSEILKEMTVARGIEYEGRRVLLKQDGDSVRLFFDGETQPTVVCVKTKSKRVDSEKIEETRAQ